MDANQGQGEYLGRVRYRGGGDRVEVTRGREPVAERVIRVPA